MRQEPVLNASLGESQEIEAILSRFKDKALAERQRKRYEQANDKDAMLRDIEEIADEIEEIKKEVFVPIPEITEGLFLEDGLHNDEIMAVVKEAIEKQALEPLGDGNVAKVAKSEKYPRYCYKLITNPESYKQENNVSQEVDLLSAAIKANSSKVKIPKPFYSQGSRKIHLYVMETMNAAPLRYLFLEENKRALEKFDLETFFEELQKCLDCLHKSGIHHRDLHAGNVMIDFETGLPCLIDFGKSIQMKDTSEDPYTQQIERGGELGVQTWMIDDIKIKELKRDCLAVLNKIN